jgi:peptidoglycan hydrolase CwlO-like protein
MTKEQLGITFQTSDIFNIKNVIIFFAMICSFVISATTVYVRMDTGFTELSKENKVNQAQIQELLTKVEKLTTDFLDLHYQVNSAKENVTLNNTNVEAISDKLDEAKIRIDELESTVYDRPKKRKWLK